MDLYCKSTSGCSYISEVVIVSDLVILCLYTLTPKGQYYRDSTVYEIMYYNITMIILMYAWKDIDKTLITRLLTIAELVTETEKVVMDVV